VHSIGEKKKKKKKIDNFTATRKYGPFKVIGIDKAKKYYRLDISRSPFPNMYQVLHVSAYYKFPKTLVPAPTDNKVVIHILGSRKQQDQYQCLVSYKDNKHKWVSADLIDDNPHYAELLEDYQDFSYSQSNIFNY